VNNFKDALRSADNVLLPSRYTAEFIQAYQTITNREVPVPLDRQLSVVSEGTTFSWVRGRNIPSLVEKAKRLSPEKITFGLTGNEWLAEYQIPFGGYAPVIGVRASESSFGSISLMENKNNEYGVENGLVTCFPNIVRVLIGNGRIPKTVLETVDGGVEGAANALNMQTAVDLVSSGKTSNTNGFLITQSGLLESFPVLVGCVEGVELKLQANRMDSIRLVTEWTGH
jgi:ATP phosphoribosyltransferase